MRDVLHEYFRPTKEEFEKLWKEAFITFDASSLLNLYGYSKETKNELVGAYGKFRERIFLPYQFAYEYSRNRAKVIKRQIANFASAEKDLQELLRKHGVKQEQPYLSEQASNNVDAILEELKVGRSRFEKSMASDEESDLLLNLFQGKVGPEPADDVLSEWYVKGKKRIANLVPPGFKDNDKAEPDCFGDYIAWEQIMAFSKENHKDVLLVTDDVKEDWWHLEGSMQVAPHPLLRKEFRQVTQKTVWFYTTDGFLRAAKEFSKVSIGDAALTEVRAALDNQREERELRLFKLPESDSVQREDLKKFFVRLQKFEPRDVAQTERTFERLAVREKAKSVSVRKFKSKAAEVDESDSEEGEQ